jgi:hypothetical protein
MSEFEYVSLSNLVEEIIDNRGRTCPTSEQGIPLIATNCVKEDRIYPTHEKVRYQGAPNSWRHLIREQRITWKGLSGS